MTHQGMMDEDPPHYDVRPRTTGRGWVVVSHVGLAMNTLEHFRTQKKAVEWAVKRAKSTSAEEVHIYNREDEVRDVRKVS